MISGSFSKSHAMTGWRIGYALGPEAWINAMLKVQSHSTSNATSISQRAAVEAATGPQETLRAMLEEYRERRDWLAPALNKIEGVKCSMPEGAFYVMPDVKGLLGGRVKTSSELAALLLTEAQVVVTPGSAFGIEGYLRISYANSLDAIKRAVEKLSAVAESLR
jgi:aspartate aminotransferase